MGEWIDIPPFVDGEIRQVDTWQDMWSNLQTLRNRNYVEQQIQRANWTITTTGAWQDIDGTAYRLTFESFGNDIMVGAHIRANHSAVPAPVGSFTFTLDGERAGNTLGLSRVQLTNSDPVQETYFMTYIWENVDAGDHTMTVQARNNTSGTLNIYGRTNLKMWALEF